MSQISKIKEPRNQIRSTGWAVRITRMSASRNELG